METQPEIMKISETDEGLQVRFFRDTIDEQMSHDIRDQLTQIIEAKDLISQILISSRFQQDHFV